MPMQPIIDKRENFTEPELILSYFIDNQLISGPDAIILLKAIIKNQKKEPELTLFPRKEKTPVSTPSTNPLIDPYNPDITDSKPYNSSTDPMRIMYLSNYIESPKEYNVIDNKNCSTTAYNTNNVTAITTKNEDMPEYPASSTGDSFFIPRELSI